MSVKFDEIHIRYNRLRKMTDSYAAGLITADEMHATIVDYTDAIVGHTVSYGQDGRIMRISVNPSRG